MPKEAAEDGATLPPTDLGVIGNTAGVVPEQPPTSSELPRSGGDIALDVGLGVADGLFDLGAGIGTTLLLNALTLGGYSTYQVGASMWQGYKEHGLFGAFNAINPFYQILKGGHETYQAADRGDYREAGSKGAVTGVLVVTTVSGIIQGLSALGGKPPGAGSGAGASETFEILDGVRRAKAAELSGRETIAAEIDIGGKTVATTEVPLSVLRSPKSVIDTVSTPSALPRWLHTLRQTAEGSPPPPIRITPGSQGTPIDLVRIGKP